MMKKLRMLLILSVLLCLALALSGCGAKQATATTSPEAPAEQAPAADAESAPVEAEPSADTEPAADEAEAAGEQAAEQSTGSDAEPAGDAASAGEEIAGGIVIALSDLTGEPLFVDHVQDGTPMQVLALREGNQVRLAWNTCQSCAGSPVAYFEYANGQLQCQNCGFTFGLDSIGQRTGGCNPKPVAGATIQGEDVVIPEAAVQAAAGDFANWKVFS